MSIKQHIVSEAQLEKLIQAQVETSLAELKDNHTQEIAAYQKSRKQLQRAWWLTAAWFACLFLFNFISGQWLGLVWLLLLGLVVRAWWQYSKQYQAVRRYHQVVTGHVLQTIAAIFGLDKSFVHKQQTIDPKLSVWQQWWRDITSHQTNYQTAVKELLKNSELITEAYNRFVVDDSWQMQFMGQSLEMSELSIQNVTGSGKNRQVKEIFTGYFVSYDIPASLTGKTFISTDGDRNGFGHQSFWSFAAKAAVQPTELEWNQFEELLHVSSDNPSEARYILTPDVMQDIYDWWSEKPQNIRISFINNKVYMLFPDRQLRLGSSLAKLNNSSLEEYMLQVAKPLWHILCLLEDVRKRFR